MTTAEEGNGKGKIIRTALEPAALEFREASRGTGKALGEAALVSSKAVRALVAPLRALVWGAEKFEELFVPQVEEKLANVPPEKRVAPPLPVLGPAVEALRFTGEEPELRELFANLLATSMDADTVQKAHPAFVEIIKQLSPDEARILRFLSNNPFVPMIDLRRIKVGVEGGLTICRNVTLLGELAGCEHMALSQAYVDNLCRLEICTSPPMTSFVDKAQYKKLVEHHGVKSIIEQHEKNEGTRIKVEHRMLSVTEFGNQFISACVVSKRELGNRRRSEDS